MENSKILCLAINVEHSLVTKLLALESVLGDVLEKLHRIVCLCVRDVHTNPTHACTGVM
jgi:hypothetical protein